jgi:uncharacterized protein
LQEFVKYFSLMSLVSIQNQIFQGSANKKALFDLEIPSDFNKKLILFVHGYMGFKDWGAWNLMQDYFVKKGYGFCKFNLTHNGIGLSDIENFTDLEAFASNSYSKEMEDVTIMIDLIQTQIPVGTELILSDHSRGGGDVLLASNHPAISKIVTLAAISSVEKRFSDTKMMADWKEQGVRYVTNQRTKQNLPHSYSQVEDFLANKEKLSIEKACKNLQKPLLIIHGDQDVSVPIEEAYDISKWTNTSLKIIKNTDHVFGSTYPWNSKKLPQKLEEICNEIEKFIT